jgi:hypothetical protein
MYSTKYTSRQISRFAAGLGYTVLASRLVHGDNPIISSNFILFYETPPENPIQKNGSLRAAAVDLCDMGLVV